LFEVFVALRTQQFDFALKLSDLRLGIFRDHNSILPRTKCPVRSHAL
jgi:hypothetical protein